MSDTKIPDLAPLLIKASEVQLDPMHFKIFGDEDPMEFEGKILWRSEDGTHIVGMESITPQQNEDVPDDPGVPFNQVDYFLSGHVTIEREGHEPFEARGGTIVISPAGAKSKWTINETLVKVFLMYQDEPIDESVLFAPRS